jgi:hypothetical protein
MALTSIPALPPDVQVLEFAAKPNRSPVRTPALDQPAAKP